MKGTIVLCLVLVVALIKPAIGLFEPLTLPTPTVTATAIPGDPKITVSWTASAGATGYLLYRFTAGSAGYLFLANVTSTTYDDTGVMNGRLQGYYVIAYNATDSSGQSNFATATANIDPPTLAGQSGKASAILNWTSVSGATSYNIYRFVSGSWSTVATGVTSNTYTHTGRTNGITYQYAVSGVNAAGPGVLSNAASVDVYLPAPNPVTASTNASNVVTVSWGSVTWADSYDVYRATSSAGSFSYLGSTASTSYGGGTVPSGATYYYIVYAINSGGSSPKSIEVSNTGGPYPTASSPWEGCPPQDPNSGCQANSPESGGLALSDADGFGPSAGDPVNLASGDEVYAPAPDLAAYNPNGPSAVFQRNFLSNQSKVGYYSPGLSPGWVHNYDIRIVPSMNTTAWDALNLVYPNGAVETITPTLSSGAPTGAFNYAIGTPYFVAGTASGTTNQWTSIVVTWGDQTAWKFELHSTGVYALSRITDRMGHSIDLSWDSQRRLTTVVDTTSSATLMSFYYGTSDVIDRVQDAYSRKVVFDTILTSGRRVLSGCSIVTPSGNTTWANRATYGYSMIDARFYLSTITVPSPTGSGTQTATINYGSSKVSSLVDANGNRREYSYGSLATTVTIKTSGGTTVQTWTQNFNGAKRPTGKVDAASNSDTIEYNDSNNPSKQTRNVTSLGHVYLVTYDIKGNVLTRTNPRGVVTTFTWDYTNFPLGRLTSIQDTGKASTTMTYYEPSGLLHTVTAPHPGGGTAVTTTYTYDVLGNVTSITTPGNNAVATKTTSFSYTTDGVYAQSAAIGQPIAVTDNLGHTTHYRYDANGRVTSTWDALGNQTDTTYDLVGNPVTIVLPATGQTGGGRGYTLKTYLYVGGPLTSTKTYDESNTLIRTATVTHGKEGEVLGTSGSAETATYTYDAAYRIKTLADGLNQTTTYSYNTRGLLTQIAYPGGDTVQFTSFDACGNVLQKIDANGVTINYVYNDDQDHLTAVQYPATPGLNVTVAYDGYGRRSSITDSTGVTTYVYGDLDELLSKTTTFTGLAGKTISYTYNDDGSRASMTTPAGTYSYSFDGVGRATSLSNPYSETSSWSYLNNDWLLTQTLGNSTTTTYDHNPLGQLNGLETRTSANALLSSFSSATYDGIGNIKSIVAYIPASATYSGTTSWTYDSKDQLTQETSGRLGSYAESFGYDSAGNPTTFKGTTLSFNNKNQRTGSGFSYDSNGSPTTYAGTTLTFDPENRLTGVGSVMTARYDGDGFRVVKQTGSGTTYFLYDGPTLTCELDGAGAVVATNTFGPHGLVSRRSGGSSVFYTFDQRGATAQRLNSAEAVLTSHAYDAFGLSNVAASDPYDGVGAQFGYYTDVETGLQLLSRRYYDPSTGRFLTRDSSGFAGGMNLYAYCANNPTNLVDASGRQGRQLWYDRVRDSSNRAAATAKQYYLDNWPWWLAWIPMTAADIGDGFFSTPSAIGHYGEGFGSYAGNPNDPKNQIAFWNDFGLTCQIGLSVTLKVGGGPVPDVVTELIGPTELHHLFPKEFVRLFRRAGIDIESDMYKVRLQLEVHKVVHGKGYSRIESWNGVWREWFTEHPSPKAPQIIKQMNKMRKEFGI